MSNFRQYHDNLGEDVAVVRTFVRVLDGSYPNREILIGLGAEVETSCERFSMIFKTT